MARSLGSTSKGKHSVGYCLFVNVCCAFHRAKPQSQINPRVISRGTGMVWPNPLVAWELDPSELFPGVVRPPFAQGTQGWKKPWSSRVLLEPCVECLSLTKGWESLSPVADTWSRWEKSWIVWLVPFEILMGKCLPSSSRFLFLGWTVHGSQVLQQKLRGIMGCLWVEHKAS